MTPSKYYPRWIKLPGGQDVIVRDHLEHSSKMGQEYDEEARLVVKQEPPAETQAPAPTDEELAALFQKPKE